MPTNLTCANAVSHFDFNIWLFFPISANLFRSQSDLYWTKPTLQLWCQDTWMASRWRYHHWQRPFAYHGICLWTTRIWFGRSQSFNWKSQMFWINHWFNHHICSASSGNLERWLWKCWIGNWQPFENLLRIQEWHELLCNPETSRDQNLEADHR